MGNECGFDIEVFPNLFTVIFIDLQGNKKVFEKSARKDNTKELYNFVKGKTLIGYNNKFYDNIILNYVMRAEPSLEGIYNMSGKIIYENDYLGVKRYKYTKVYKSIDLMSMLFSKSLRVGLKELQATMKWYNLMESTLSFTEPVPIDSIDEILEYNENDVLSTIELYNSVQKDVTLRDDILKEFDIECMSKSAITIGVDLMTKFISQENNISVKQLESVRNTVNYVPLVDVINPFIEFKDSELNKLLEEIKQFVVIPKVRYFGKRVTYKSKTHDNTYYFDVMNGGLHMVRRPGIVKPKKGYIYEQRDFGSYYPSQVVRLNYKHTFLGDMFNKPYTEALEKRLRAKADGNKIIDTTYKLLLNSLFGQFNNEYSHFYDPALANRILMNGQLMLLMLIEELDLIGCEIISANTDSVDIIFKEELLSEVNKVCDKWSEMTNGITVDADRVKQCVFRDINAYFMELELPDGGSYVKEKGAWTTQPTLGKGFDKPIVYKALREYFINQTPVNFCGCRE